MISFSAIKQDDNGEHVVDSPKELKKAVNQMSRIPKRQSPHSNLAYSSVPNLEALVDPTTNDTKAIEGIQGEYLEYPGRVVTGDDSDEDDADSDLEGWFLDTDDYVNSRNHLNPDGSLDLDSHSSVDEDYRMLTESLLRMQAPNVPASFLPHDKQELTLENLLQQTTPQDPSAISEELHRKVFEQEEGYLNQSEIFRKSLTGDSAASLEAAQWRRGADYRRRQEKALDKLNQDIDDFEAHLLLQDESRKNKVKCFKCGFALSPEEVEHTKAMQTSQRLCSLCYGDLLVAKSDVSFFRDAAPPPPFRQGNRPTWRANETYGYRSKTPNNAIAQNVPNRSRAAAPRVEQRDAPSDGDDIERLKQEVKALQDELHHWKENDLTPAEAEEATGPWSQVIDPDTGEVFYWNEETEEMKWEKEE
jgi:hypothetical protein